MRLRLLLSFFLIVVVSVGGVVLIAREGAAAEVRRFMFRGGMVGGENLIENLEAYYAANGSWEGVENLLGIAGETGRGPGRRDGPGQGMIGNMMQRLRLADPQGNVLVDTGDPDAGGRLTSAEQQAAVALQVDGRTVGYLLPEGGLRFSQVEEEFLLSRITRAALSAGLIAGGVALLLALLLAYTLLRPVRELTQAAAHLARGDLSQRVHVRGDDELARLGHTFNHMADSLQTAERSRRAMTADIAHELRNPLAVQRANLEALQDGIYPMTPENLQPVIDQNLLLARLVDDLRTLALAESGQLVLERRPADFAGLVKRVAERFDPTARSARVEIQTHVDRDIARLQPVIDPDRVEQIIANLISNAMRYTPEGGRITLVVSREGSFARLDLHDTGPGIPEEALPFIFERFYRADRSRSRQEGGSGLGLAIARQFAEAHGGRLTATNHPQGGAVFTLLLPMDEPPAQVS